LLLRLVDAPLWITRSSEGRATRPAPHRTLFGFLLRLSDRSNIKGGIFRGNYVAILTPRVDKGFESTKKLLSMTRERVKNQGLKAALKVSKKKSEASKKRNCY